MLDSVLNPSSFSHIETSIYFHETSFENNILLFQCVLFKKGVFMVTGTNYLDWIATEFPVMNPEVENPTDG